jgi:2-polyprenyl-3-methyl-5-hydroxy-6-metoxy-1,4-benzoquinol methylase
MKKDPIDLNKYSAMQDKALKEGVITEEEWYSSQAKATTKAYCSKTSPWAQCGHGGTEETWTYSRIMPLLETLHKSGSFIDIGCAVGYINESLHKWTKDSPIDIIYFGVDICEELINIAKERMPIFKENYFVGNIDNWIPPHKFDFVRTHEINYVPENKHKKFINNLIQNYVKSNGRLIIGPYSEPKGQDELETYIQHLGFKPTGYLKKKYGNNERKVLWFDL